MADLLISPEGYTAPGAVPRKLLAGVFVVVAALAMGAFLLTSPSDAPMTGDEKARAMLKEPDALRTQAAGSGHWIDEAASAAARAKLSRIDDTPAQDARVAPPSATEWPVLAERQLPRHPAGQALPSGAFPPGAAPATPGAPDAGAVERERAARAAAMTVFDEAAAPAKAAPSLHGAGTLPDAVSQLVGGDRLAPVLDAIKATQPVAPPTPAEEARRWTQQLAAPGADPALRASPPVADLMLFQGTVIPCVLTRRINSDLPGVVTARVSMDVYDSRTSRRLLLPKGSLLSGAYNNDVKAGQSRLQFAFTRLRLPDGSTFDLPGATGSDAAGQAGIEGDVDRHFFRSFGAALLLGVLADQVTRVAALPNGGANGSGGVSATGQVFIDTARAELDRHKAIPPTVTVAEGSRIHVEVVRDMVFDSVQRRVQ